MEIVYFNDFIDLTKAFIDLLKLLYENWEMYDDIFFFSFLWIKWTKLKKIDDLYTGTEWILNWLQLNNSQNAPFSCLSISSCFETICIL